MKRRFALLTLLIAGAVVVWALVWQPWQLEARRQRALAQLPPLPAFDRLNQISLDQFRAIDLRAREHPLSADAVGRLGMLYHAYQFPDQARRCYELARELAPREFRWIYYQAVLEKAVFRFREGEALFHQALDLRPDSAELWAELGDLYLQVGRKDEAAAALKKALEIDPVEPVAALGQARLAILAEDWNTAIALLTPLLGVHPRLSLCHKYLALAYGNLGRAAQRDHHQSLAEYGSALESALMRELHELSVEAILEGGDPSTGSKLVRVKCAACHTRERIDETRHDRRWWARTVRRMQRLAGSAWLTDEEAASVVAYLAEGEKTNPR